MKTITKIGISAISAAAVAGVGYLGKKVYDKKKNEPKSIDTQINETASDNTEVSENDAKSK